MITHGCSDQQVRPLVIAVSRQVWKGESPSTISGEQMSSRELTQSAQVNSNANGSTFEQGIRDGIFCFSDICLRSPQARTFVCSDNEVGHLSFVSFSSRQNVLTEFWYSHRFSRSRAVSPYYIVSCGEKWDRNEVCYN